jgi:hypothetical protein
MGLTRDIEKCPTSELLVVNLKVTQRGLQLGAPIHQALSAIDVAFVV